MTRALLALVLLLALIPSSASATVDPGLQNGGLQWRSSSKTPVVTLYPIAPLSAQNVAALTFAAAAWNDTGYVRYIVSPVIPEAAFTYCSKCVAIRPVTTGAPFTSWGTDHGYLTGAAVYLLEGQTDAYTRFSATHELGHVLGLGHSNQGISIMNNVNVILVPACPGVPDVEAASLRYPWNKGSVVVPPGFAYPTGAGC